MNLVVSHVVGSERSGSEIRRVAKASVYNPKLVEDVVAKASLELMESKEER